MVTRLSVFVACGAATASAFGANIPMFNSSFELPVMSIGGFTTTVPPGWVSLSPSVNMGAGFYTQLRLPTIWRV